MPTLGWIQETAWDRLLERGSDNASVINPEYPCRICGEVFSSISARDQHEVNHPVLNPTIFIDGKEICSEHLLVTSPLTPGGVFIRNVDYLTVNGVAYRSSIDMLDKISEFSSAFLNVQYGNEKIKRQLKITVRIADAEELKCVDEAFIQCFEVMGLNDAAILAFTQKVQGLQSVQAYSDGMVRYIQGLMAKDNRSESAKFEEFIQRFNQATSSLRSYETALAHAIRSVVDFNRNDFSAVANSGIVLLDSILGFFKGGGIRCIEEQEDAKAFPVDFATEFVLSRLMPLYKNGSLEELKDEIKTFTPQYLSLQDKTKFDYICYRKCLQIGDGQSANKYRNSLRFDDAFSGIIEN